MFDPDDIDAPDIFGDLGRDAMKVGGPLALLLFAPILLLITAFGSLPDAVQTSAAAPSASEIQPDQLAVMGRRAGRERATSASDASSTAR
jgi:hypothetical protein